MKNKLSSFGKTFAATTRKPIKRPTKPIKTPMNLCFFFKAIML